MLTVFINGVRRRYHLARAGRYVTLAERQQAAIASARLREQQYRSLALTALRRARGYLA